MSDKLRIKILDSRASLPKKATLGSVGYDLCAILDSETEIAPGETFSVHTGIAVQPPDGCAVFVFGRSGLGVKYGISPANAVGVIDPDYRGEIIVGLHNHSKSVYTLSPGERIAQMVVIPVADAKAVECDYLDETMRGSGGFGSTGKNSLLINAKG